MNCYSFVSLIFKNKPKGTELCNPKFEVRLYFEKVLALKLIKWNKHGNQQHTDNSRIYYTDIIVKIVDI
jgi:hypothetical protein